MAGGESGDGQREGAGQRTQAEEAPPVPPATAGVGGGAPGVASPPNPGGTPPGSVPGAGLSGGADAGSASTGEAPTGSVGRDGR